MRTFNKSAGFTIIELVMVIVILGILAAVAVPKIVDLEQEATDANTAYTAGKNAEEANIKANCKLVRGASHTSCN